MTRYTDWKIPELLADPSALDGLIEWKMGSMEQLRRTRLDTIARGAHMQRQFTIELRVDFADANKLPEMQKTIVQAAVHCLATARLISDNPKATQIAAFADDFYTGHNEISILEDTIAKGLVQTGDATVDDQVSDELLAAVAEMKAG